MTKALIVVDVQKDFCEGGTLAVWGGNEVAEKIAKYIEKDGSYYEHILFTKDWHKPFIIDDNGGHFAKTPDYVNTWPEHCVENTEGSEFHPAIAELVDDPELFVFYKGYGRPDYSGFQGMNGLTDYLDMYLRSHMVETVHVVGIAGDYCVKATALDAATKGYQTLILPDLVASVRGDAGTYEGIRALVSLQQSLDFHR